jgi:ankyrin repeat protein
MLLVYGKYIIRYISDFSCTSLDAHYAFILLVAMKMSAVDVVEYLLGMEQYKPSQKNDYGPDGTFLAAVRMAAERSRHAETLVVNDKAHFEQGFECHEMSLLFPMLNKGHHEVARQLLRWKGLHLPENGLEIWLSPSDALCRGRNDVLCLLLEEGLPLDHCVDKLSLLFHAARDGLDATVRLLLDRGADIHAKNWYGLTALHLAAGRGHEATVRLLLDRGANIHAKNYEDRTALHLAALDGLDATVRLLLDRGADIDSKNNSGSTALLDAAENGHEATVRLLLDRGADIHAKNWYGLTVLHFAAQRGHEPTVRLLLDRGADIHSKDSGGWTALLRAAYKGHEAIVRLLLDRGADIHSKNNNGWTALFLAAENRRGAAERLLRDRGAD